MSIQPTVPALWGPTVHRLLRNARPSSDTGAHSRMRACPSFSPTQDGVGEQCVDLSGCTSQLLLLRTAADQLTRLGIVVAGASTEPLEKHEHLGALSDAIAQFSKQDALAVPHTDRGEDRYLLRWTMVFGGSHDGLIVTDILDSVAHTRAVIDVLTAERLRA